MKFTEYRCNGVLGGFVRGTIRSNRFPAFTLGYSLDRILNLFGREDRPGVRKNIYFDVKLDRVYPKKRVID